jgi:hypothetical protein
MDKKYSTAKISVYIALTIVAMMPSLGVGIPLIADLSGDISRRLSFQNLGEIARDEMILSNLGVIAAWLLPLLLGCAVASLLVRRRKTVPGFFLGIVLISVSYLLLTKQAIGGMTECAQDPSPYCEEATAFLALAYVLFWGVNLAALTGFIVLMTQLRIKRETNIQVENK